VDERLGPGDELPADVRPGHVLMKIGGVLKLMNWMTGGIFDLYTLNQAGRRFWDDAFFVCVF
jgi:hypothetical protein